jgi:hypothetical protein
MLEMVLTRTLVPFQTPRTLGQKIPAMANALTARERMARKVFITVAPSNAPQQRPRATGVKCKQSGIAGSAACGCWAVSASYGLVNNNLILSEIDATPLRPPEKAMIESTPSSESGQRRSFARQ